MIQVKPTFKSSADVFVKSAKNVVKNADKITAEKLAGLFDRKMKDMPKGLDVTLSQVNGSLLCYSKQFDQGVTLRAIKKVTEYNRQPFMYVLFKEFENGELKDTFAVDAQTGELIRLDAGNKAKFYRGEFSKYREDSKDPTYQKHLRKIKEYTKAIFREEIPNEEQKPDEIVKKQRKNFPIAQSHYDELPLSMQDDIAFINDKILSLSNLIEKRRGLSQKIIQLKSEYEPIIYHGSKQKNTEFKYHNLESLSVLHIKSNPRFTRIIHTNSNGIETHYLIDDGNKVVSNLNKKRPWLTPEKYRYMTTKEIESTNLKEYIAFLKDQMSEYYDYMNKNLGAHEFTPRAPRKSPVEKLNSFMDEVTNQIQKNLEEMKGEIDKRADNDANEIVANYFSALSENFERYAKDGLNSFIRKVENYLKSYTNSNKE